MKSKFLNVPLEPELYKQLKITAIQKDLSIQKIVDEAIRDILIKYERK